MEVLSPKVNSRTVRWYPFYAMFSPEFSDSAICDARLQKGAKILDPWVGTGTSAAAALKAGFSFVGSDINPAMVMIARGRFARPSIIRKGIGQLTTVLNSLPAARLEKTDPLCEWFAGDVATEMRNIAKAIDATFGASSRSHAFFKTCLFELGKTLAKPYASKNPTWIKKPKKDALVGNHEGSLQGVFSKIVNQRLPMLVNGTEKLELKVVSSTCLDLEDKSVDFVLTSPPYCTRIDYAIGTSIELAILNCDSKNLKVLRDASMGTSTIRKCPNVLSETLPKKCSQLIKTIGSFEGHATPYYLKTFVQYFLDLHASIQELCRVLKPRGQACIVVQDSYFKGIRIDLASIVQEMMETNGWGRAKKTNFNASKNLRIINTRSRLYSPNTTAVESVLQFWQR